MTAAQGISIGKGMKEEEYYLALYSGESETVRALWFCALEELKVLILAFCPVAAIPGGQDHVG